MDFSFEPTNNENIRKEGWTQYLLENDSKPLQPFPTPHLQLNSDCSSVQFLDAKSENDSNSEKTALNGPYIPATDPTDPAPSISKLFVSSIPPVQTSFNQSFSSRSPFGGYVSQTSGFNFTNPTLMSPPHPVPIQTKPITSGHYSPIPLSSPPPTSFFPQSPADNSVDWLDTMTSTIGLDQFNSPFDLRSNLQQQQLIPETSPNPSGPTMKEINEVSNVARNDQEAPRRSYHRVDSDTKFNDPKYQQRRAKNNKAVRKSRDARKVKEEETKKKLKDLASDNERLQYQLNLCQIQLKRITEENQYL